MRKLHYRNLVSAFVCVVFLHCDPCLSEEYSDWTTSEGETFTAKPDKPRYDQDVSEMIYEFQMKDGSRKAVPASTLGEEGIRKFGEIKRRQRIQKERVAKKEAEQQAAQEAANREQEEKRRLAERETRLYTHKSGKQLSWKTINDVNDEVTVDFQRDMLKMEPRQAKRFAQILNEFAKVKVNYRDGNVAANVPLVEAWWNSGLGKEIENMLQSAAGQGIIPCADGRALEWQDAWIESMKAWNASKR